MNCCKSIIVLVLLGLVLFYYILTPDEWENYKQKFNKTYPSSSEDRTHYVNFAIKDKKIKVHNEKYADGKVTYIMSHNEFSDMSSDELSTMYMKSFNFTDFIKNNHTQVLNFSADAPEGLSYFEYCFQAWSQRECGSCWAFATSAQIEIQLRRKNQQFGSYLSPQYLLDCAGIGDCRYGLLFLCLLKILIFFFLHSGAHVDAAFGKKFLFWLKKFLFFFQFFSIKISYKKMAWCHSTTILTSLKANLVDIHQKFPRK